jgi:hypothetical protein
MIQISNICLIRRDTQLIELPFKDALLISKGHIK